jgi:5'-nucleotidase
MLTIAVDMDEVLADLVPKWLSVYNKEWDDNLVKEDLLEWDITKFVKPECGDKVYEIIMRDGFYVDLDIIPGAQEGVEALQGMGYNICIASASPRTAYADKHNWIKKHFPTIDTDNIIFTKNKSLVKADLLLDDGVHNLESFTGFKVLFATPWNQTEERFVRVNGWEEFVLLASRIKNVWDVVKEDEFPYAVKYLFDNVSFVNQILSQERAAKAS